MEFKNNNAMQHWKYSENQISTSNNLKRVDLS